MVELRVLIPSVAGSSPASLASFYISVAQWQRSGLQSRWLRVRVLPGVPRYSLTGMQHLPLYFWRLRRNTRD